MKMNRMKKMDGRRLVWRRGEPAFAAPFPDNACPHPHKK
ncbi:MAG: hypothetical protein AVDCRST_MAG56-1377 [uncultured Cytophagales bacterium]|uniref:Uncharacterized protein n=1 Tax=uncultured Cytophagales bacterium TaxID=158755 RepID=A0A6J4I4B2_9SPHI|nr:MAG: hypothetical protein AVDCRST_MAG56-1377 [uncultured Cytophagales bacterium]